MSGSSLDGLDLGLCWFQLRTDRPAEPVLNWRMERTVTIPFSAQWRQRLQEAPEVSGRVLCRLDTDLGHWMGTQAHQFLGKTPVDFISSHGHTVFHFPAEGYTIQLGAGAPLAAQSGLPVVSQLRAADVAHGGEGAPLAPLADRYLFPGFDAYLNLGGIANLSYRTPQGFVACDIGGANQILDALAMEAGLAYDDRGALARSGQLVPPLLASVEALPYFTQAPPKSLDNGWVRNELWPHYQRATAPVADRLHTACRQLALQLGQALHMAFPEPASNPRQLFVTGGGAFNDFLVECIRDALPPHIRIYLPQPKVIAFKETALIALAGALRWFGIPNSFASATGADRDTCNGVVYLP